MKHYSNTIKTKCIISTFSTLFLALLFTVGCKEKKGDEAHLTILHLNDVYEVTPVSGGTQGGMARVATLKKQLLEKNPNTYITLSGDIYGPSALSNAAIINGKPMAGENIVAALNKVGIDYFTLGDHEFDQFSREQVLERFKETKFPIISSNYADAEGKPFKQSNAAGEIIDVAKNAIFTVTNKAGKEVRVGIFGITEPLERNSDLKVTYTKWEEAATEQIAKLKGGENPVDILIAMTHFSIDIDRKIAAKFPKIDLILGGDDHEHMKVAETGAPIYKSDSNGRNIYIIDLYYNPDTKKIRIKDRIQPITDKIPDDKEVLAEVNKWVEIGFDAYRKQGMKPERLIGKAPFDLDGFASSMRNKPTKLTDLVLKGIIEATGADMSLVMAGVLRLDDLIPSGSDVTEYDTIRAFPNDLEAVSVQMKGNAVQEILNAGQAKKGAGEFILYSDNISLDNSGKWLFKDKAIDENQIYQVAILKFFVGAYSKKGILIPFPDGKVSKAGGITLRQAMSEQIAKAQTKK